MSTEQLELLRLRIIELRVRLATALMVYQMALDAVALSPADERKDAA